ncbi:MAG TPA: nuclear transport factor 2 family protein [Acidimicrobiales bacterium]|nr:nuclear transport factor 2 family protein [Acidimicrobiales bacterium]
MPADNAVPPLPSGTLSPREGLAYADVQVLLDKQALHELNARWARSVDRGDEEMFLSCYSPGAVERHGTFSGSPEAFVAKLFPLLRAARCYHFITNELYQVLGDRATGDVYCPTFYDAVLEEVRTAGLTPTGRRMISGGRYLDRYEKIGGRWVISERLVTAEWTGDFDKGEAGPFVRGRQDRDDPMYGLTL